MAVIGVGIDLIDIDRIARALARRPRFAERCFTDREAAYCRSRAFPAQHFAARFAAKEAVGKVLGIGMTRWREVEVVRDAGPPARHVDPALCPPRRGSGVTGITCR